VATNSTKPWPVDGVSAPVTAALLMTGASLGFSVMNILIRNASAELDTLQIAFFRNFFAFAFMLPWLASVGFEGLRTTRLKLHLVRGAISLCGMLLWFYSVTLLPLAEAVALNFTVPLFATAGAALILHEVVRARRWTATVVGFLGVLVILRPGFQELHLEMLLPVLAALFMALSVLVVKSLARTDSPGVIVLYMNVLLTPLSLIPALFVWRWPSAEVWAMMVGIGLLAALSHLLMTRAYKIADASAVLPFDYTRLPFIALLAFLFYGEVPDGWTWVGAAIIAASTFYIARREAVVSRERREALRAAGKAPEAGHP
jgi:drug/metabolite transporter (DMT)-like permease